LGQKNLAGMNPVTAEAEKNIRSATALKKKTTFRFLLEKRKLGKENQYEDEV